MRFHVGRERVSALPLIVADWIRPSSGFGHRLALPIFTDVISGAANVAVRD
jgi:hypothetical protein